MDSLSWMKRLKAVECPDSTYFTTQDPLVFKSGRGSMVWDVQGKSFIDLCAGFGVLALGHNPQEYRSIWEDQLSHQAPVIHGMGDVYPAEDKIQLMETLLEILPESIDHAALALTGAGANEIALKTCLLHRPKGKIIVFEGAYHGLDLGVLPLASRQDFKSPFANWLPQELVIELPFLCDHDVLLNAFANNEIAGVFVEPVQGRAGIRSSSPEWLRGIRSLCDAHDALLVYDEVFTGLGRIGTITTATEVPADLICFGKPLGGGLPLSACCGTSAAFQSWPESTGEAIHTGTFFGHPLSCRLGIGFLKALLDQDLATRSKELGEDMRSYLQAELAGCPGLVEIRGSGLMAAIEFDQAGKGAELMNRLRSKGVITLASGAKGQSITMTPALNIPQQELFQAIEILIAQVK